MYLISQRENYCIKKHILSLIDQMHYKGHHVMCSLLSNVFEAFNDKNLGMCLEEATQFDLDCIFSEIKSIHYILVICHISHIQTFLVVHVQLSMCYCLYYISGTSP
jgi:hypothetical protein